MVVSRDVWSRWGAATPFDPNCKFVTSPVFSPLVLAAIRLTIATYTLVTLLVRLIWEGVVSRDAQTFFSYFTNLSYIGICTYFWASGVQTLCFARGDKLAYPLQRWPRALQLLHTLLWTTITTLPIVVTPVYWGLLASGIKTRYDWWSNISVHALNLVFALFEAFLTNIGPQPWFHTLFVLLILGLYLALAYITHATQGFYPYSFLDPKRQGVFLAAYLVGIPILGIVGFTIVWFICWVRMRVCGVSRTARRYGERVDEKVAG